MSEPPPAADPSGMWQHIAGFGEQLRLAWAQSHDLRPPVRRAPSAVVVAATGGSAAAADIVAALAAPTSEIPMVVARGRELPNFVGETTLVVVVSCSGNTPETLALYDDAWRRDAPILAITRGGALARRCAEDGIPVHTFDYPPPPRAAIAHTLAPLLRLTERLGLAPITSADVHTAASLHEELTAGPCAPVPGSPCAALAARLAGAVPLLLAAGHLAPAAERGRNQLAENSKLLAASAVLPEAAHNLIAAFQPGTGSSWTVLTLEAEADPAAPYFEAVAALCAARGIPIERLEVPGATPLQQAVAALALVDALSWHLAIARGVDPTPIPEIDDLRSRIGARQ
ncbi:SIS domain-containing protein [Tepidiforma sp.]|uniref:SIS domain-containing protein n=1 Tax=Tepidiforma sp. TaxID=2682230 RepID=UPI002ADD3F44|nr:SIS domain-containing protein [Tepidiforma sp.]